MSTNYTKSMSIQDRQVVEKIEAAGKAACKELLQIDKDYRDGIHALSEKKDADKQAWIEKYIPSLDGFSYQVNNFIENNLKQLLSGLMKKTSQQVTCFTFTPTKTNND